MNGIIGIAEQWIEDFYFNELEYDEIRMDIIPSDDEEENGIDTYKFEVSICGKIVHLWVFYDTPNAAIVECEEFDHDDLLPEIIAREIYEIDKRWMGVKKKQAED